MHFCLRNIGQGDGPDCTKRSETKSNVLPNTQWAPNWFILSYPTNLFTKLNYNYQSRSSERSSVKMARSLRKLTKHTQNSFDILGVVHAAFYSLSSHFWGIGISGRAIRCMGYHFRCSPLNIKFDKKLCRNSTDKVTIYFLNLLFLLTVSHPPWKVALAVLYIFSSSLQVARS